MPPLKHRDSSGTGFRVVIFTVFAADVGGLDFIRQNKLPVLPVIQLHGTPADTAVPQETLQK